jgi:hypothetical protein
MTKKESEEDFKLHLPRYYDPEIIKDHFLYNPLEHSGLQERMEYKQIDYSNLTPLFPLTEEDPLVEEGDTSVIYGSKTESLPQLLTPSVFTVERYTNARIVNDDLDLIHGLDVVLGTGPGFAPKMSDKEIEKLKRLREKFKDVDLPEYELTPNLGNNVPNDFKNTYFVVNIGHAHLLGVAYKLMQKGIDCSFVLQEGTSARFKEAAKYWARRYKDQKENLDEIIGYATLIDCHRNDPVMVGGEITNPKEERGLSRDLFPTVDKLRELGIEKIMYLKESRADGKRKAPNYVAQDLREPFKEYQEAGISITCAGIDYRWNRRGM